MIFCDKRLFDQYMKKDTILRLMDEWSEAGDEEAPSQKWLRALPPKRMTFYFMYGDLLFPKKRVKVLDVGGNWSAFTRKLGEMHDYTILEIMDIPSIPFVKVVKHDWYEDFGTEEYDVIMANDIFPTNDQRLQLFIDRFLPRCREMRLSITWFTEPKFYKTMRVDGDEVMYLQAWDGSRVYVCLMEWVDRIIDADLDGLFKSRKSIFANGRQVCIAFLKGGLA